jgi:hypothetical protein
MEVVIRFAADIVRIISTRHGPKHWRGTFAMPWRDDGAKSTASGYDLSDDPPAVLVAVVDSLAGLWTSSRCCSAAVVWARLSPSGSRSVPNPLERRRLPVIHLSWVSFASHLPAIALVQRGNHSTRARFQWTTTAATH